MNLGDTLGFQLYDGNNVLLGSQSIFWTAASVETIYGAQINCGHPGTCFFPALTTTNWSLSVTAATGSFDLATVSMSLGDPTFGNYFTLGGRIEGQAHIEVNMVPGPTVGAGLPVERVKMHFVIVPAAVEAMEVRNTINSNEDCLTIDHKRAVPIAKRGFHNERIPITPAITVAGEKTHALAITLDNQTVAVVSIS